MKKHLVYLLLPLALIFTQCRHNDYTPRPQTYLRIDIPAAEYILCDTMPLPFTFERNANSTIAMKKNTRRDVWVDVNYPEFDGVVFLSYKRINDLADLRGQTDTSLQLMQSHKQFSYGIDEQTYEDKENHIYASTFHIKGSKVASTYQFWITDSCHNFLRGALYLNKVPNNDSLAPILNFIQQDIDHAIETLRWR